MSSSNRSILHSVVAGLALATSLAFSQHAQASQEFPAALQEAAGMPCTPSCVICHGKTPGDIGSFQARALSQGINAEGLPPPHDTAKLKSSYQAFAAKNPTVADQLKAGKDPATNEDICGDQIVYGCAVQRAKPAAASSSLAGPLWAVGAMVLGGLLRRRRQGNP
jgi:hypothetical protein